MLPSLGQNLIMAADVEGGAGMVEWNGEGPNGRRLGAGLSKAG